MNCIVGWSGRQGLRPDEVLYLAMISIAGALQMENSGAAALMNERQAGLICIKGHIASISVISADYALIGRFFELYIVYKRANGFGESQYAF